MGSRRVKLPSVVNGYFYSEWIDHGGEIAAIGRLNRDENRKCNKTPAPLRFLAMFAERFIYESTTVVLHTAFIEKCVYSWCQKYYENFSQV